MEFDTILVGYNVEHTLRALEVCNRLLRWQKTGRRVLVCNHAGISELAGTKAARSWEIVHGSNSQGEFSGWQEGLDFLGRTERGVLLSNDSITVHSKFTSARRFALSRSLRQGKGASLIGFVDYVQGELAVKGLRFDCWVRTNCFGLTAAALQALSYDLFDKNTASECVNGGLNEALFFSHLSPDLEYRLCQHLFHGGWYAAEPLSVQSVERLTFKARSIVLEKWLAARCHALNIATVDPFDAHPLARNFDKAQSRSAGDSLAGFIRTVRRKALRTG